MKDSDASPADSVRALEACDAECSAAGAQAAGGEVASMDLQEPPAAGPPPPPPGAEFLPSVGSKGHERGACRPCAHVWKPAGCFKGQDCTFCHLCDEAGFRRKRKCKAKAKARPKQERDQCEAAANKLLSFGKAPGQVASDGFDQPTAPAAPAAAAPLKALPLSQVPPWVALSTGAVGHIGASSTVAVDDQEYVDQASTADTLPPGPFLPSAPPPRGGARGKLGCRVEM